MSRSQPTTTAKILKKKICKFNLSQKEIEKLFISKKSTKCQK